MAIPVGRLHHLAIRVTSLCRARKFSVDPQPVASEHDDRLGRDNPPRTEGNEQTVVNAPSASSVAASRERGVVQSAGSTDPAGRQTERARGRLRLWQGIAGAVLLVLIVGFVVTQATPPTPSKTPMAPTAARFATAAPTVSIKMPFPNDAVFTQWGSEGTGPGRFNIPTDIALDAQGNLYVTDLDNHRIQKLSPTGQFLAQWGSIGGGPGQFNDPGSIALDVQGNVYVTDVLNSRIQKLSPTGQALAQWGSEGDGPGQFRDPAGIALDGQGNLYVTDRGNNRIQELSATGQPLAQWGSKGTGPGQFSGPDGIALDAQSNLYVADSFNNRIQKISFHGPPQSALPLVRMPQPAKTE